VLRATEARHVDLLVDERRPDLVLLDTGTSRGEGWELLGRIAPRLPVIVISGRGLEEDIVRGLDAGAADYLPKPFRSAELLARVRARLRETQKPANPPAAPPALGATMPLGPAARSPAVPRQRQTEEEPVFIPHREEQRLMHDPGSAPADEAQGEEIAQLPLGRRLRASRLRKRITLVQAELESKVRMHYIQAMEEEKFSLLPRGPITEELLRTYAAYIGVDVGQALEEYRRSHYNAPVEPPAALGSGMRQRVPPRWAVWLAAASLALLVGFGGIWLIDPTSMTLLAGRARALVAPPTATPTPTTAPSPTEQPTSTATPTSSPTSSPTPTATPTATPSPPPTATSAPTATPTPTPRRRG
jgi:DNA-binding response OmpR family regulator